MNAALETRLGKAIDDEDFWEEVLQFFVNHPELPLDQVGPVVDFLAQETPQIDVKGRTCASLLRLVLRRRRSWDFVAVLVQDCVDIWRAGCSELP